MKKAILPFLSLVVILSALAALSLTAYATVMPVTQSGLTYYVADNGRTSAVVKDNGITWLKEESGGSSAWYGIENSQGLIEPGSLFWVMWLDAENDADIYHHYYDYLDDQPQASNDTQRLFLYGVVNPEGVEENIVAPSVPMYIQLGEDWAEDDIKKTFPGSPDAPVEITFKQMEFPGGTGMFAEVKSNVYIENGSFDGFPTSSATASVSGSAFSGGAAALFAGSGFLVGAAVTTIGMTTLKKKKDNEMKNA